MVLEIIAGTNVYNLVALFVLVFVSSLGFPTGLIGLVSSGAIATTFGDLFLVFLVAYCAAVMGDLFAYEIARRFFSKGLGWFRKFKFFKNSEQDVQRIMKEYEFSLVFFSRFVVTGLCAPVSYISGFEKLNRKKFYSAVFLGEAIYCMIYPAIGFLFRESSNNIVSFIENLFLVLLVLIILWFISRGLFRKANKR